MPHAVFRADATPQLGGGHVYRCLTLAHALAAEGWSCSFACNDGAERVVSWLDRSPFRRVHPDALGAEPADLLVIDHYEIGQAYESDCRPWAKKIFVIDDLADRQHDADFLLDQNIGRRSTDYAALVPPRCQSLLGPSFALLREAFLGARLSGWRPRRELRRVLIAMGATDPANATGIVLSGLAAATGVSVDVVLGGAATHLDPVRHQASNLGDRCRVLVEVEGDAMAALIGQADLAIAAAGGSAWERCSLGLPTLLVALAENQHSAGSHLVASGAARWLGSQSSFESADVVAAVETLVKDPSGLAEMSRAAALQCDGLGARRAAAIITPEHCADGETVILRPAVETDSDAMLAWHSAPGARRYFNNPRPPTPAEHADWYKTSLSNTERLLNVIEVDGRAAGMLRLDRIGGLRDALSKGFSVSILVDPGFERRGVAKAALRAARRLMAGQRLVAEVMDANIASRRAFEASGYRPHDGLYVNNGV